MARNADGSDTGRHRLPVPDPTELTDRAVERMRVTLMGYVDSQLAVRDQRLYDIDEATRLRHESMADVSREIDVKIGHLRELHSERFDSVDLQFKERDTRSERESRDNKVAVDAAFAAQKEAAAKQDEANAKAIDKSERATAETIKTNLELTRSTTDSLVKGLDEVKGRVTVVEATKAGSSEGRADTRQQGLDTRTLLFGLVATGATVVATVVAVAAVLKP